jgi:YHS domain-containing protein
MIMKTTKALVLLTLLGGVLLAADPSTQESKKPVNKMCAVMPQDAVDPKITYEYKGKLIGFCCQDCIPEFKKDPEKYMKDLK